MDLAFIAETVELSKVLNNRLSDISYYLWTHNIQIAWRETVQSARAAAGVDPHTSRSDTFARVDASYDIADIDSDHIHFKGTDFDNHRVAYRMPIGFLFPETRDAEKAKVREQAASDAVAAQRLIDQADSMERTRDEADFEALALKLGKTINWS